MFQRCLNALGDCSSGRDVMIRIEGDRIVEARSDRLRRVSRFFRQALTEDAKVDGKYLISISGISKDVLETLLTYAETGTLNLYEHEVADVYYAAHKLQMPFVVHKCLQVRPLASAEALAASHPKALPKSPQAPSGSAHVADAAKEVKDRVEGEAKVDQPHAGGEAAVADGQPKSAAKSPLVPSPAAQAEAVAKGVQAQPIPGTEAQAEGQAKPELKSPPLQPLPQEAATTGVGEAKPEAEVTAGAKVKPDIVQASSTQSETEIPRILRVLPKPVRLEGDDAVTQETQDATYKAPEDKAKPGTSKDVEQTTGPDGTVRSPAAAEGGSQAKASTPKDIEPKAGPGGTSVQTTAADGGPQAIPGSSKDVSGSRVATPKAATGPQGTPVQGVRTPLQKPAVEEVIGPAASQAQVLSAAPLPDARTKEQSTIEQPRSLTPPSATARTFLDVVLEHFTQLTPETIRVLVPTEVIDLLQRDDLEICCEIPAFVASLVWLHADYPGRSAYARELMGCVRFGRMSADQLIHCFFPPLRPEVVEIPEVKQLLLAGCCYLCASLQQCSHLFPQYAVQPRKYSGRHMCHLWQLPEPRETEDEVRVQLDILRETYLQRRQCHCADSHDGLTPEGRLYGIARTLMQRRRYLDMHCYQPDPEETSRGHTVVQRSFGKRRYSVQKRLEWTEGVWRQVGFSGRLRAPDGEPVIALLGGCEPDKPDRVSAGLCMARLYPKKSPFFKRFGILPRPLYHVKAVCFNRTVYVVGGLDLRQAALRVKRPSKCCFALDLSTMQWSRLADMSQGRLFHVLVEHQGKIYAIGGLGDRNRMLSGRLCCSRMASASVILEPCRLVLAGGAMRPVRDAGSAYLVDDVVALKLPQLTPEHLVNDQRLPRLPSARLSSSMTVLANGGVLVVGGATYGPSGFRSLDDVLLLKHPGVDVTWTKLCPMPFRVHSALLVAIGTDAYVIGGCTDRQDGAGTRTDMLVMRAGCAGHRHEDAELCWEAWGTLPGRLVGMEAVLFQAEDARPSDPSA